MINWFGVFANSLWILGLAVALATLSYASWQASIYHIKTRQQLKQPGILISFSAAAVLFCAGMAATSDKVWEIVIWSVLGILFIIQIILLARQNRNAKVEQSDSTQDPDSP